MTNQSTDTILMIEPADFSFNTETAVDNEFQHNLELSPNEIKKQVMEEFHRAVKLLESKGIRVLTLPKNPKLPTMPDAVFPNNWFSTDASGNVYIFPMAAPNRRLETQQLDDVLALLKSQNLYLKTIHNLTHYAEQKKFLEGTGSMVFDRVRGIVYAAISIRTDKELALQFSEMAGFKKVVAFETKSSTGMPYYHTNVVMSVGTGYAVVCLDCVTNDAERKELIHHLSQNGEIISINHNQTEKSFCANGLEVCSVSGKKYFILSQSAYDGFQPDQRNTISKYAELLPIRIPTIEHIGGGSARCMMAEIFLKQN